MSVIWMNKEDFSPLLEILRSWLEKNAKRVSPLVGGFIPFSLSPEVEARFTSEMGPVYRTLKSAGVVSYEKEIGTIFIPKKEHLGELLREYPESR